MVVGSPEQCVGCFWLVISAALLNTFAAPPGCAVLGGAHSIVPPTLAKLIRTIIDHNLKPGRVR
jgi:hypothetical protein